MSAVLVEKTGSILKVKLNRPEVHNAFNVDVIKFLTKLFKDKKTYSGTRAIVLSGEGPSFCAGGDLTWMKSMLKFTKKQNIKDAENLYDLFQAMFSCPVPLLGKVHGNIRGGGLGLTAVCDIVVAEENSQFGFSEAYLGLVPSVICAFVGRKMPESSLQELMVTGKIFSAKRAYETGLVHFVGTAAEVDSYLETTINNIHKCGPEAIGLTKKIIDYVFTQPKTKHRSMTAKVIAERRVSKEGQEGMKAFFEKRSPTWRTRE